MKNNKIFAITLSIIISIVCLSAPFESVAVNSTEELSQVLSETAVLVPESDLKYNLIPQGNPDRAVLTGYTGNATRIILPETVEGYPLSNYGGNVFSKGSGIEYVRLPSTARSINSNVFGEAGTLKYIDVAPENPNLISIDGVVFNHDITTLYAFPNGAGGSYTIPDGVKIINSYAFTNCYHVSEVIMPNSVEAVYREAFMHCHQLQNVKMSVNLTSIGDFAFSYCDSLRSIDLPYGLSYIGAEAFLGYFGSDNHRVYYLTEGISYVPGTYSEEYVKTLHLPDEVKRFADRKIIDEETGVTVIDPARVLPNTGKLELTVNVLPADDYINLLPGTFNKIFCYEITLTNDGVPVALTENIILRFDGIGEDIVPSGSRVFRMDGDNVIEYMRTPNAPFVGASAKNLGIYIIGTSNDFTLKGDINGDKVISSYDAMFALYLAADLVKNPTPEQINAADYNGDGKVTTEDALLILRKAADII